MFGISAINGDGCRALIFAIQDWLDAHPATAATPVDDAAPVVVSPAPFAPRGGAARPTPRNHDSSSLLASASRLVIKVGSSLVTNEGRGLDHGAVARWAAEIAQLTHAGKSIILVSSGAIAEGMQRLGWSTRPRAIHDLQAAAAVGQMGLVHAYETAFAKYGLHTAQVLLTHEDLADRRRYLNARTTLTTLLWPARHSGHQRERHGDDGRDPVRRQRHARRARDESRRSRRARAATDQQGLFTADPRLDPAATLVTTAAAGDPDLERMAGGAGSAIGRGGMLTKILAAKRAARSGASTIIACGREPDVLARLCRRRSVRHDADVGSHVAGARASSGSPIMCGSPAG